MLNKIKPMGWLIIAVGLIFSNPISQAQATDEAETSTEQARPEPGAETAKNQSAVPREALIDPDALKIQIPSIDTPEQIGSEMGQDTGESAACTSCRKKLMDERWSLREKCLSGGGDENSCNGSHYGETCCHCQRSPETDPACWDDCDLECLWTEQCGEACGWESAQEQ